MHTSSSNIDALGQQSTILKIGPVIDLQKVFFEKKFESTKLNKITL